MNKEKQIKHPIPELQEGKLLNVSEIYTSLQGEGTRSGLLTTFVRLQGCLLRCTWCDTPYALERKEIIELRKVEDVIADIEKENCNLIMLTGGEPLEQTASLELISTLCDKGYEVTIETNGQADISTVDKRAVLIMDIKCPASGMHKKNRWDNLQYLKKGDEIKFVIAGREDYEWAKNICIEKELYDLVDTVLFSPAFKLVKEIELAEWIIKDRLPVRMQLQTHKYIWHPEERGV